MHPYSAPLKDIRFVMHQLLGASETLAQLPAHSQCDSSTLDAVTEEMGKFVGDVLHPLNAIGDKEGCELQPDGSVSTPRGFKEAFKAFADGGWSGLACDPAHGGQGLPTLLNTVLYEMLGASNLAWAGYPGLSHGAYVCLERNAAQEQKDIFLTPLASGKWTGTMCLTEPHCGSDLGLLKTRATPDSKGSYRLTGTKIFISSGEHDLAENIVHLVLARIDGAPARTKGISLFVVPRHLPLSDGSVGSRNGIRCGSVEHKMGIRGNATCELILDDAQGWLVGEPNCGLQAMFVMMNAARVGVGIQAVGVTDYVYQSSKAYAMERLQMRAPGRPAHPELPADPIVVHPDVRRMLLTQKAYAEGGRALAYWTALLLDEEAGHPDADKRFEAGRLASLLTPIVKAFLSDNACEAANHAVQVHGGHGYIRDAGVEQYARDIRITPIYEGTNGIQALDLLGRKVLGDNGHVVLTYVNSIESFALQAETTPSMVDFTVRLHKLLGQTRRTTVKLAAAAALDPNEVGAAAHHYLRILGHLTFAYLWARMASIAIESGEGEDDDRAFYESKLATAHFYFDRLLPEVEMHFLAIAAGSKGLMVPVELFN